jgi:RHS repeat-associated protein
MVKGGVAYRIVADHLGSPRLVVDAQTGAVAQRMDYDELGNVILNTNPGFQPFGFAGGLYDRQTGLVRLGARDYSTEAGTWTTKDPSLFSGGDTNLYAYALNDPVNLVDTNGQFPIPVPVVVGGLVVTTFAVIAYEVWLKTPGGQEFLKDLPNPFARPWESRRPKYKPGAPGKTCPPPVAIPGARPRTTPPPPVVHVRPDENHPPTEDAIWGNKRKKKDMEGKSDFLDDAQDWLTFSGIR